MKPGISRINICVRRRRLILQIMYLPIEGLFAEAVNLPGLLDELQRTYRVCVAGPTTLAALLNSLQMGFKTLAIEKRTGEVWRTIAAR